MITEALIQGQMHPREYSNTILSSIMNLLMVYMNENNLFSLVTDVFIAVLKLMKISDFHKVWQTSTKHNNKLVWFNFSFLCVMIIFLILFSLTLLTCNYALEILEVHLELVKSTIMSVSCS